MKNLKVYLKLIVSFMLVVFLTLIVGIIGIIGLSSIDSSYSEVIDIHAIPLPIMSNAIESLQLTRVDMRNAMLYTGNTDSLKSIEESTLKNIADFEKYIDEYSQSMRSTEAIQLLEIAQNQYNTVYKPTILSIIDGAKNNMSVEQLFGILNPATPTITEMTANYSKLMKLKLDMLNSTSEENTQLYHTLFAVLITAIIIAVVIAMFMAVYISGLISKPIITVSAFLKKAGSTGDLSLSDDDVKLIEQYSMVTDEIGDCIRGASQLIKHISVIAKELEIISNGDLSTNIEVLSSSDVIGNSIMKTLENQNKMFVEIHSSSAQVTMGAEQISDGAQLLASGSTEQAATLEELSASITDIALKVKENSDRTKNASSLAQEIIKNAEKGSRQMEQMINAVNEINQANQNISRVIKAIDDIAFQTNILALNAAVEAARAGSAGKGFAVVAEEVRNLAAKSAESAKDTGELIANSIEKAELGTKIAASTSDSLAEIVSGINESTQIISEIAKASEQQTSAIEQINIGIGGVTQVVQQNSATAEQSAAAAEEMSGQANILKELISQFKLKD